MRPLIFFALTVGCTGGKAVVDDSGEPPQITGWTDLSLATRFGCALDADGYARCSGTEVLSPRGYEPDVPLTGIATSFKTGCGLQEDLRPLCFGIADEEHSDNIVLTPAPDVSMSSLASGPVTMCGIRAEGATPICWGSVQSDGTVVGSEPSTALAKLSQSSVGACGITTDGGDIVCWGDDEVSVTSSPPEGSFVDLDLGGASGVAITTTGELVGWGTNAFGVVDVPDGRFVQVAVGAWMEGLHTELDGDWTVSGHACAIDTATDITCWGDAEYGATIPPSLGPGWTDVDTNGLASCGIHSGDIYCWGTFEIAQELPPEP